MQLSVWRAARVTGGFKQGKEVHALDSEEFLHIVDEANLEKAPRLEVPPDPKHLAG